LSGGERNDMADNFQKKWLKAGQFEELPEGALSDNLGVEIVVVGLKSDALQVKNILFCSSLNFFRECSTTKE